MSRSARKARASKAIASSSRPAYVDAVSDLTKVSAKEVFEQTGQAVLRGVAELAKTLPGIAGDPVAGAFVTVFFPAVGLALGRGAYGMMANRLPQLTAGYAKAFGSDSAKVGEHAERNDDNPSYNEVLYNSFRRMMDAADPAVVEHLGYLAGQYAFADRTPDSYFRGLGRLLCDLESSELKDFTRMMRTTHTRRGDLMTAHEKFVEAMVKDGHQLQNTDPSEIRVHLDMPGVEVAGGASAAERVIAAVHGVSFELGTYASAHRLFGLMRRESLAGGQPAAKGFHKFMGDQTITITLGMVERIVSTVDPRPEE
jgi:hypothetical protein